VTFSLDARAFAHWDTRTSGWLVEGGDYLVEIGDSSHDIALTAAVRLPSPPPARLTLDSRVSEFLEHPVAGPIMARAARGAAGTGDPGMLDMVGSLSMRRLMRFPGVGSSLAKLPVLMAVANNPVVRGLATWWQRRKR
jgi:beta-glucosidase